MRIVSISNQRRGLVVARSQLTRAIAVLDTHFEFVPADLAQLTPAGKKRARALAAASKSGEPRPSAVPDGELSLVFLTDDDLAELHGLFLDDPSTTDVITFEGQEALGSAGEICVSVDTAQRYAEEASRSFAEELTLYLVHGWLHLAGYDDLKPTRKRRMRAAEARAIALLKAENALPSFSLRPSARKSK